MALVIRHRCERCGATWQGEGAAASPWIRCGSCRALLDFDWQSFFDSDAYKQMMRDAQALAPRWAELSRLSAEASALAPADPRAALAKFQQAAELQLTLSAYAFPPEAQHPGPYRQGFVTFMGWWQLQCVVDPAVAPLQRALTELQSRLDIRDPLPTLQQAMELMRRQFTRMDASDAPPDPDGMTSAQRFKVTAAMVLGAYLPLLSPSQRRTLLEQLHGKQNVAVQGDPASDDLGLFIDWTCPACGLTSLQGRTVAELCCVGCFFRRPFQAKDLALPALTTRCTGCGAQVTLPEGAVQATCSYCHAVSTRLTRSGAAERAFAQSILEQAGAPHEPPSGTPGLPVNAANRAELVLSGLARVASAYATVVGPERFASVLRPTLKLLGLAPDRGLAEVRGRLLRDGAPPASLALLEGARPFLAAPRT